MNNYLWSVTPGGTITAGGGTSDATATVTWTTAGPQVVSVNYTIGTSGCTAASSTPYPVTVKPKPAISNTTLSFQQCPDVSTNIDLQSTVPFSSFAYTASGSSGAVTGFLPGSVTPISQTLFNSGFNNEIVTYVVTPTANTCQGDPVNFLVTVFPKANVLFNPASQAFCSGGTTAINLSSSVTGTVVTYAWSGSGSSGNVSGFSTGSGNLISQPLTNTGNLIETVTYSVIPTANNCTGQTNNVNVSVDPLPVVTYTACTDIITTTSAKPVRLKGGLPPGGTYSGPGVTAGFFNPSSAGTGTHTIDYAYSNTWGCNGNSTQSITVVSPPAFSCGNILTDIRDNNQYPTIQIGSQCWFAVNLNYASSIGSLQTQRDNCISEKYCFSDTPSNCQALGGLYQWDEMMQYNAAAESQGFCPPGWHVPSEANWNILFSFYTSNGFAANALKTTGYSGFNAELFGVSYSNIAWKYNNFASFFWSSTLHGPSKAYAHAMNFYNPSVSIYPGNRSNAFFVRCIKD